MVLCRDQVRVVPDDALHSLPHRPHRLEPALHPAGQGLLKAQPGAHSPPRAPVHLGPAATWGSQKGRDHTAFPPHHMHTGHL